MTSVSLSVGVGLICALLSALGTNLAFLFKYKGAVAAPDVDMRQPLRSAIDLCEGRRAGTLPRFVVLDEAGSGAGLVSLDNVIGGAAHSATVGYRVDAQRKRPWAGDPRVADVLAVAFSELVPHRVQAPTLGQPGVPASAGRERVRAHRLGARVPPCRRMLA